MKVVKNELSRREILVGAGKVAAGAAIVSVGAAGLVVPRKSRAAQFPWGYTKLDPQHVGEIAYNEWYKNFCCQAVVTGIIRPLQEKIGEPYASLPLDAFKFGHGGAVGWGTLCGTLNGAGIATGFIAGHEGEKILNDVIAWYAGSELPQFNPANPRGSFKNVNQSNSPLCHISVGKWMKKEGVRFFSPERKDRCARLAADVAMKTVSLLNEWADGNYKPTQGSNVKDNGITSQENCTECHGDNIPTPITG